MRRMWLLAVTVWFLLAGSAGADDGIKAEIAQVNTAKYPEVTLYVSVVDGAGQVVEGLEQDDFRITEDGVPVAVIAFNAGSRTAIATVLAIDRSGSMGVEGKMEGAKTAATTFVDLMRAQDRAALVAFDDNVATLQLFTSDKNALKTQIRSLGPGGCTAWYDGVYASVDLIASLEGRRSVILLSDGIDCREDLVRRLMGSGSSHSLDEAIQRARNAGIPVYAIGLGRQATQTVGNEGFDEAKLRRVATETGGKFYHAPSPAELKQLYSSLSTTMQKEYVVTYRSPRPTYDGTRRNIVVAVQRSGGPEVTTRGGYLEQHLVNIRSDPRLFLAFFLPLLLLLVLPVIWWRGKGEGETSRQVDKAATGVSSVFQPTVESEPARSAMQIVPPGTAAPAVPTVGSAAPSSAAAPVPPSAAPSVPAPVIASPSAPGAAPVRLVVRFPLGPGETTIGRAPDNTILLSDASVAPHHACVTEQSGRYIIRDLSNGQTYVSYHGDPVQERPTGQKALRDGSVIRFGQVRSIIRQPAGSTGTGAWLEVPFTLDAPITIGRDPVNRVVVNSPQVALQQAELRQEGGRWVICDLGGGGGVLVSFSGDPAQARALRGRNALKVGSRIYLGNVTLELQ